MCLNISGLDGQLTSLAGQISAITGHHTRMRYPDMVYGSIPAEAYSREESLKVVELARQIIDHVQSHFLT
ncbi:hypothetical protein DPMN_129318 [Dreissena polymorpha]|uniref:HEPN domain-containing protein n=1 Tax=Dreissena polymorpha TaxID=45954 RepID=A0A9D4H5I7_DREPO|nr:hypothetical protein DPMN_129318 [Dreissena polymorpha]